MSYIKTTQEFNNFLKTLKPIYAFDTETTSLDYLEMEIEGFSISDGKQSCYVDLVNNEYKESILANFSTFIRTSKVLMAHNMKFDMKVLKSVGIDIPEDVKLYDTMIADHLINETRRHGLKSLAKELLGEEEIMTYEEARSFGPSSKEFVDYATKDAEWTYRLAVMQIPLLQEQGLKDLFWKVEMPFVRVNCEMELNGMKIDVPKLKTIARDLENQIHIMDKELRTLAGVDKTFNFNSSKQLIELLFTKLKLPILGKTKSGKPSTGAAVIEKLKHKSPVVMKLEQYKIVKKLYTAYFADDAQILSNLKSDGRVHPNFNNCGTKTGRLSCSQPNLQQLPKPKKAMPIDTRQCFVASEGNKMFTCDFSGQELRVLAELSKDETLIDVFEKGGDLHLTTANGSFNLGIPKEALFSSHPDYKMYKEKFDKDRSRAKPINFGIAYGMSSMALKDQIKSTVEEAQEAIDGYFNAYPRVKDAMDACHALVDKQGYVTSFTGRRRRFQKIERYDKKFYPSGAYRQSFNFLIQGYSADMMRIALINTRKLFQDNPKWGAMIVGTIHDEAICECKEEYVNEASKGIKEVFESCVKLVVPVVSDIGIGDSYSEAK